MHRSHVVKTRRMILLQLTGTSTVSRQVQHHAVSVPTLSTLESLVVRLQQEYQWGTGHQDGTIRRLSPLAMHSSLMLGPTLVEVETLMTSAWQLLLSSEY